MRDDHVVIYLNMLPIIVAIIVTLCMAASNGKQISNLKARVDELQMQVDSITNR